MKWHTKSISEAIRFLETSEKYGLSAREVEIKKERHGLNVLEEKKKPGIIAHFFAQFNDFMILVLLAAAFISFLGSFLRGESDFADPIIILAIIMLNAVLGVIQEHKAEKSLEALKKMAAPAAKTLRDGKLSLVATEELVPGDIIFLETGDYVPADARLISCSNLKVEEASLTGESLPVEKDAEYVHKNDVPIGDRHNMVFSSSIVSYGKATAVVVETGMNTEVGKIAEMIINDDAPETPLQKKLSQTGKILGIGALVICGVVFFIGILNKIPYFEMFLTSVSLAVAAIPEGLPAIVTIMLAIGVQRMAKRNAIIRKLPAVETLGSANVICSDKTGTLTQNKMKVIEISDGDSQLKIKSNETENILLLASLCNDAKVTGEDSDLTIMGDPTETAIIHTALLCGIDKVQIEKKYKRVAEIPFDSSRKLMSTINKMGNGYKIITKGAPDFLLNKCTHCLDNGKILQLTYDRKRKINSVISSMAEKALRTIAVAYREIDSQPMRVTSESTERNLIFAGIIGMIDPPREEVKEAVAICKLAGIKPVMITGDHVLTATAIAKKIGIMDEKDLAMTGEELENTTQEELSKDIFNYSVFARVSPSHKVRIVKAFQSRDAVVAMTGDGVNDAPALKAADIGCAMGITGTDVAKGTADMILTDDNFATIVDAVKEGRGIYSNIRKSVHFLISSNIGEIITIFVGLLMGWPTPLLAIQLLWVNLVTDSLPAVALGLDPAEESVMHRKPYNSKASLFSRGLGSTICVEGCMIGMLSLLAFAIGNTFFDFQGGVIIGRTMAFATLSISQLVHAFNMRSDKSLFSIDLFSNMYLFGAFFVGLALQVSVIMIPYLSGVFKVVPLNMWQWLIVAGLSLMPLILVEMEKAFRGLFGNNYKEEKVDKPAIAKKA